MVLERFESRSIGSRQSSKNESTRCQDIVFLLKFCHLIFDHFCSNSFAILLSHGLYFKKEGFYGKYFGSKFYLESTLSSLSQSSKPDMGRCDKILSKRKKDKKTKRQRTKRRKDSACWVDVTKVFGFELELIEQDANKVQTSSNNS